MAGGADGGRGAGEELCREDESPVHVRDKWAVPVRDRHGVGLGGRDKYPKPQELWDRTFPEKKAWRDRFAAISYPDKGGSWSLRFYQEIAVNRVLERIADGQDRVLLTLATGTGKTSIAFQIAWKLFQARWNLNDWKSGGEPTRRPRILFLADRNNLADQAFNDFTSFGAFAEDALARIRPEDIRKKGRVPKNANVFLTIFQTFMSGGTVEGESVSPQQPHTTKRGLYGAPELPSIPPHPFRQKRAEEDAAPEQPTPYFGEYPPDFFDFIVIDECHRGGANDESTWRDILTYFKPAVQLGLTATPKRKDNVDTYRYFGEPVYIYSLKDGINDGFLTPFRVKQIATTLDEYVYTSDDKVIEGEVEAGKRYVEADFNRFIEIKEREAKRVKVFMDEIDQAKSRWCSARRRTTRWRCAT